MRAWPTALLALIAILGAPPARAQVTVDVAKITCRQLFFDKTISPNEKSLAIWLSGYYNANCRLNQDVTVMDAVPKALDSGN